MLYMVDSRGRIAVLTVWEYCGLPTSYVAQTRVFFSISQAFAKAREIEAKRGAQS